MTALGQLVDHLAPSVLTAPVPLSDAEAVREVAAVSLYDLASTDGIETSDVVLGIGLRRGDDVREALSRLAERHPAALVVRADLVRSDDVRAAARSAGLVLLTVEGSADWMQLALLVRELVEGARDPDDRGGLLTDDLFRVANTIAALVDAPVTIEDPHSRILAFSEGQERADEARRATILGRRAPDEYYSRMKQHGVFRRLLTSPGPMFVPGRPPNIKPRVVQPVRASGEFMGSIWLVADAPLDSERERALGVAAHTVALHLLRQRLQADSWRTTEVATVTTLLQGGTAATDIARRTGLLGRPCQVVAFAARSTPTLDSEAMLLRLWDGLRISLSAVDRSAVAAKIEDKIHAVVPVSNASAIGEPDPAVRKVVLSFLANHGPKDARSLVVGLGTAVGSLGELALSRDQALRAVEVLQRQPSGPQLADIVEVGAPALVMHLVAALEGDPSLGAASLRRLRRYDEAKNTQFVVTVAAWLDAFGDTEAAAARLRVHPNTIRYRIRKLRELGLIDLADRASRLALLVHLQREELT